MNLRKVTPGQKLRISADTWNTVVDAARDYQRRSLRQGAAQTADSRSTGIVQVKNASGQDCYQFEVLGLDAGTAVIDPADNEQEFRQRIVLAGVTPAAAHADAFGILQEPVKSGKIGRAMLVGVTQCWVDIKAEADTHAEPAAGTVASLVSASSGIARILWKQAGTGLKLAIVRLGGGGGARSGYPECTVICSEAIPANSLARIVSYNRHADMYLVAQPDADDLPLSQLVWVPQAIPALTPGLGLLDFGDASLLTDDNVKAGDTVGSKANSWKAKKGLVGLEVAAVISGTLAYVHIIDPGSAYAVVPTITASGGDATRQATFLVKLDGDRIGAVTVLDSGLDYTAAPTLSYAGNAILEPVIVGMLDSLAVTDGGAGYDKASPPAVTIANTGTVLATATAVVDDDGKVASLTLTGRGFGFFTAPAVTIAPPPGYPGEGKAIASAKAVVA
jgi:hypothetical protein